MKYLFSPEVHVTGNLVGKNANVLKELGTTGNNSTWRAIDKNSTQWDKNSIERPIGNTRHAISKNSTRQAIGKNSTRRQECRKYAPKQQQ